MRKTVKKGKNFKWRELFFCSYEEDDDDCAAVVVVLDFCNTNMPPSSMTLQSNKMQTNKTKHMHIHTHKHAYSWTDGIFFF